MSNIQSLSINKASAIEGMHDRIQDVKSALEQRINLSEYSENIQTVTLNFSVVLIDLICQSHIRLMRPPSLQRLILVTYLPCLSKCGIMM